MPATAAVTVVCGAPNVRPDVDGLGAARYALAGRQIGRAVIEGVESEGMLASAADLDQSDHSGLLELRTASRANRLPGLAPDWIIEIDNKSLTHRPDLWGHYGMAREVAAITGGTLLDPVKLDLLPAGDRSDRRSKLRISMLCPRYSALVFENVTVGPSPLWLQARLEAHRAEPHQQHRRRDQLRAGGTAAAHACLRCRQAARRHDLRPTARAGETLTALNGETYNLNRPIW